MVTPSPWDIRRILPSSKVRSARTVICEVKAFVEATPISGPAWMYTDECASRSIEERFELSTASEWMSRAQASRKAASVSAVSPDWLMGIIRVRLS